MSEGQNRHPMRWTLRSGLALTLLSAPALSWALGMGGISVSSHLNEPFRAEVTVNTTKGELPLLRSSLASDDAYRTLGLEKTAFLNSLEFTLKPGASDDRAVLVISSAQVAKEPFFSFLIELGNQREKLVREYTVLLDPNTGQTRVAQAAPAPVSAPAPAVVVSSRPTGPTSSSVIERAVVPPAVPVVRPAAAAPVSSLPVLPASPFQGGATERNIAVPQPEVHLGETPRNVIPRPKPSAGAVVYDAAAPKPIVSNGTYGPIAAGDTLWMAAAAVRPSNRVTMNQVMWALFSNNEDQFDGNLNLLHRGAILKVPSEQAMIDVSPAEADALVVDEAARHKALLNGITTTAAAKPAAATPAAAQKVEVEAAPKPTAKPVAPSPLPAVAAAPVKPAATLKAPEQAVKLVETKPEAQSKPSAAFEELPELPADEDGSAFNDLPELDGAGADIENPFADESEEFVEVDDSDAAAPVRAESDDLLKWAGMGLGALLLLALAAFGLNRKKAKNATPVKPAPRTASMAKERFATAAAPVAAAAPAQAKVPVADANEDTLSFDQDFEVPDFSDEPEFAPAGSAAPRPVEMDQTVQFEAPGLETLTESDSLDFDEPAVADELPELDLPDMADDGDTGTLDLGAETVSLELNEDPLSEADFQLAYGLYDEAALLLNRAIEADPDRLELHEKLAETHFAAGNADDFRNIAQKLQAKKPDPETWQRIAIMGQQLCPGDELFAADMDAASSGSVDLDMDFASDGDAASAPDAEANEHVLEFDLGDMDDPVEVAPAAVAATPVTKDNVLEFDLDDIGTAAAPAAAPESTSLDFEADFDDLDLDAPSAAVGDLELPDLDDLSLDDLDAEFETTAAVETKAADADDFADLTLTDIDDAALDSANEIGMATEFELDDVTEEPAAAAPAASDDFADLTLSDISDADIDLEASFGTDTDFDLDDLAANAGDDLSLSDSDDDLLSLDGDDDLELGDDDATEFDLSDLDGDDSLELDDALSLDGDMDDFDLSDTSAGEISGGGDEAATKLDLARAYVDMGETEMAQSLLQEVVSGGSEEQQAEARGLLDSLS